jgi:glycosyltransferase involved in cell wall biosynthesis
LILPRIFKLADIVTAPSTGAFNFVHSLGIPKERIQATCYTVDNDWWISQSQKVDRTTVRKRWGIPIDARVALFCAKLQPWKRPQDALQAFAAAKVPDSYLVIAGDGPMRSELEEEAKRLKISAYVRFLGFVNQSELPSVYTSSDIFLFTSEYEPFGVVVNEAMLCKCPVIASDQVGSGIDLIVPGQTGMIYEATNIQDLSKNLSKLFLDSDFLQKMSLSAFQKIQAWSPDVAADTLCQGIIKAIEQ